MSTDYRSLYDKDYIGAWDIQDKDINITITKVIGGNLQGVGGRKSRKPVIYMRGTEKGFAINATNGKTIASMYGPMIEDWVGKRITLYKSMTRNPNGDGDVECIRVRPKAPAGKNATEPPQEGTQALGDSADGSAAVPTFKDAVAALDRKDWDLAADIARGLPEMERLEVEQKISLRRAAA